VYSIPTVVTMSIRYSSDNIYMNKQIEQIRILQDFSIEHFDMIPVTINQLLMIEKEYNTFHKLNTTLVR